MLLLCILWDDWPIFMISASKEQLQQQLEFTLLKSDCHSWWISKMQSRHEDTLEERYAIKLCFKLGKNATEMYGMLQTAFRLSCMNRASVFEWHKRFKEGRKSVRDDERCGRSKEVNIPELILFFSLNICLSYSFYAISWGHHSKLHKFSSLVSTKMFDKCQISFKIICYKFYKVSVHYKLGFLFYFRIL